MKPPFKYDHLTDSELLRLVAFETDPLLLAVAERLEIAHRKLKDLYGYQTELRPDYTGQTSFEFDD